MNTHVGHVRYEKLREGLCPRCPLYRTCPQFEEQLDACEDAAALTAKIERASPEEQETDV